MWHYVHVFRWMFLVTQCLLAAGKWTVAPAVLLCYKGCECFYSLRIITLDSDSKDKGVMRWCKNTSGEGCGMTKEDVWLKSLNKHNVCISTGVKTFQHEAIYCSNLDCICLFVLTKHIHAQHGQKQLVVVSDLKIEIGLFISVLFHKSPCDQFS